ncbi:MAG: acyl carrier protein [Flavobacteriales bacterium]|nr:acyl carrier protein [Flavobacteriales bacterium]
MNKDAVIEKINAFLVDEFEVDETALVPDANLKETLDLDSLDYVDLVVVIENTFGFKVKAEDFRTILTVQDFYNYILNRLDAEKAA